MHKKISNNNNNNKYNYKPYNNIRHKNKNLILNFLTINNNKYKIFYAPFFWK